MGGLYVLAIALGRQNTAAVTIALAAGVMTALDPQVVHDVSFQLSFAATLGLILLTPRLAAAFQELVSRSRPIAEFPFTQMLLDVATMTLAATIFTMPIIAINFHRVSLVAPVANLFAVPAFVIVALTSGLAAVTALVLPDDAMFLSWLAWPPAAYLIAVIRLFAGLSSQPRSSGLAIVRCRSSRHRRTRRAPARHASCPPPGSRCWPSSPAHCSCPPLQHPRTGASPSPSSTWARVKRFSSRAPQVIAYW